MTILRNGAAAASLVRRAAASLLSRVRPERRTGAPLALPPARRVIVIKPDPERYGFIQRKALAETEASPPWDTAAMPALTDKMIAAIEAGTFGAPRPSGGEAA
jgi:hypothetical protein